MTYVPRKKPVKDDLIAKSLQIETGCIEFQGRRNYQGYGCYIRVKGEQLAHRAAWTLINGPIPKGLCVLHKCDNPPCINPDHLFLGTRLDNNRDRANKKRTINQYMNRTHCKRGHEVNDQNSLFRKTGTRYCKVCYNDSRRKHK